MDIAELLEKKKEEILRIAARHGARNVRVFVLWPVARRGRRAMWTYLWRSDPTARLFSPAVL